jgi:Ulp1 family protease
VFDRASRVFVLPSRAHVTLCQVMMRFLADEARRRCWSHFVRRDWDMEIVNVAQQRGTDCGIFTIQNLTDLCLGRELQINANNAQYFRRRIAAQLLTQEIH